MKDQRIKMWTGWLLALAVSVSFSQLIFSSSVTDVWLIATLIISFCIYVILSVGDYLDEEVSRFDSIFECYAFALVVPVIFIIAILQMASGKVD